MAYHLLGDYKLAAAELEEGLRQNQDLPGPNMVLGIDELKLGAPAKAIPPLKRAFMLDPLNLQAGEDLAEAYLALGDYAQAGCAYRSAFERGAGKAESLLHLGKAYLQMSSQLREQQQLGGQQRKPVILWNNDPIGPVWTSEKHWRLRRSGERPC